MYGWQRTALVGRTFLSVVAAATDFCVLRVDESKRDHIRQNIVARAIKMDEKKQKMFEKLASDTNQPLSEVFTTKTMKILLQDASSEV
ncbi:MAG TPA: hypothetical protein V6C72_08720, partial [Chroococcales cyanobacterium]